jgi:hypothetical protein
VCAYRAGDELRALSNLGQCSLPLSYAPAQEIYFKYKDTNRLQNEKLHYEKTNYNKAGKAISINKGNIKTETITRYKQRHFIVIKEVSSLGRQNTSRYVCN